MTTRRLVVLVFAAFAALVATAPQAGACSCVGGEDGERYRAADAAVIGTVIAADDERGRIRVEHDFKVDLGDEIELPNGDEPACGLDLRPGDRVSVLLDRTKDGWTAGLCDTIDPDSLPGARDRLPSPAGAGTAELLLHGGFSAGRMAALDAAGQVLAYGAGRGETYQVRVCPGSTHAVELVGKERRLFLAVRRLRDLRVVRERRLPSSHSGAIECGDAEGRRVAVEVREGRRRGRIVEVGDGGTRVLRRAGPMRDVDFAGGFAFIDAGPGPGTSVLDLITGLERRLPGVRGRTEDWAVSPDGTHAAAITHGSYADVERRSGLVVARLRGAALRTSVRPLPDLPWLDASVIWRGDDRVLLGGDSNRLRLYDTSLRRVFTYASRPDPIKLLPGSQGRLFGIGTDGQLHVIEGALLRDRVLASPPAAGLYGLTVLPQPVEVDAGG